MPVSRELFGPARQSPEPMFQNLDEPKAFNCHVVPLDREYSGERGMTTPGSPEWSDTLSIGEDEYARFARKPGRLSRG